MYKFGNRSKKRMKGVNPILIKCATNALLRSKYDMTIPWMGGLRTAEDQARIFEDGNSKLDGVIKKSYHQSGNALDIIPVDGYGNRNGMRSFAQIMFNEWVKMDEPGYQLEWGGFWRDGWDMPHWQLRKI